MQFLSPPEGRPWGALLLLCFLLLPSVVAAGDSFAEAVRASLERHPEYPLYASRREVGAGYRQQADSLLGGDPEISLLAKSDTLGSDDGYREYEAGLSLPLWLPGQRDALAWDEAAGVVRVDAGKCNGCGLCLEACPEGAIFPDPVTGMVNICDLCDGDPECVKWCTEKALQYQAA